MSLKLVLFTSSVLSTYVWSATNNCLSIVDCRTVNCQNVTSCPDGEVLVPSAGGVCGKCCSYCAKVNRMENYDNKNTCYYEDDDDKDVKNVTCSEDQKCCPPLKKCIGMSEECPLPIIETY